MYLVLRKHTVVDVPWNEPFSADIYRILDSDSIVDSIYLLKEDFWIPDEFGVGLPYSLLVSLWNSHMYLSGERSSQPRTPTQHQVWHFEDIPMDYQLPLRPCWRPTNPPWFETEQVHIHLRIFTYPFFTQYTSNSCNFTPPLEHRLLSISQPTFPSLVLYSNSFKIKYWAWFTAFFCVRKLPFVYVYVCKKTTFRVCVRKLPSVYIMYHNILYVLSSDSEWYTVGHRVLHAHASNRVGAGYHAYQASRQAHKEICYSSW